MDLLSLKGADRIIQHIWHIDLFSFNFDIRMFSNHQPTTMSEKETALCIVGICIGFAKFVVNTVIAYPFYYVVLKRKNQSFLEGIMLKKNFEVMY